MATGQSWLHQSWSGDLLAAFFTYLPPGDDGSHLQYWAPATSKGPSQNDCWVILSTTTKPVLAHLWLNYLLDADVAYGNFVKFTGYQPPQNSITPDALIANKVIPENLRTTIMTADAIGPHSLQETTLTSNGQKLWQAAYARFRFRYIAAGARGRDWLAKVWQYCCSGSSEAFRLAKVSREGAGLAAQPIASPTARPNSLARPLESVAPHLSKNALSASSAASLWDVVGNPRAERGKKASTLLDD